MTEIHPPNWSHVHPLLKSVIIYSLSLSQWIDEDTREFLLNEAMNSDLNSYYAMNWLIEMNAITILSNCNFENGPIDKALFYIQKLPGEAAKLSREKLMTKKPEVVLILVERLKVENLQWQDLNIYLEIAKTHSQNKFIVAKSMQLLW